MMRLSNSSGSVNYILFILRILLIRVLVLNITESQEEFKTARKSGTNRLFRNLRIFTGSK